MKLQLRKGAPEDVPNFVETVVPAFSTNLIHQRVFPQGTQVTTDFWQSSLAEEIHDPKARFVVVEDMDTTPPTFVAFANILDGALPLQNGRERTTPACPPRPSAMRASSQALGLMPSMENERWMRP